ncbi:DUF5994 family protein [Nocardia stercoris]|uniref:Uncharacterized protein n=1 Tax=Nocardia stercoris TaxID=2483361 RepID=A0A3M2KSW0_9NOCA|nr:DUF5994 family protein [Nocardia stercoris]RMI28171.1 hypothetical protein EBN03_31215 [Nocardia stercoris]
MRPRGDGTGYVDGIWWPRTQHLAAELPGLITVLRPRLGPVWRVVYDPTGWSASARRLQLGSRRIRLDPYPFVLFNTMYVCSAHGIVVVLQVIPSTTDGNVADAALAADNAYQDIDQTSAQLATWGPDSKHFIQR